MRRRIAMRIIGWLGMFMSVVGVFCISVAVAGEENGSLIVSSSTAVSVGMVIVIIGVVGSFWQLRNGLSEQRLLMRLHCESPDRHLSVQELEKYFLTLAVYEVKHESILATLHRIEQMLKDQASRDNGS